MNSCIRTSHELAAELLLHPNDILTVTMDDKECVVEKIRTVIPCANLDDGHVHKTLVCRKMNGNLR